jgi:SEC-C motif-containing protein
MDTHHPRTRDEVTRESVEEWAKHSDWLGLEVHDKEAGEAGDEDGRILFTARYRQGEHEIDHTEEAVFEKLEGSWRFVTGRQPPARRVGPKVGRNDPCPCGSGKKHKKCCLNAPAS